MTCTRVSVSSFQIQGGAIESATMSDPIESVGKIKLESFILFVSRFGDHESINRWSQMASVEFLIFWPYRCLGRMARSSDCRTLNPISSSTKRVTATWQPYLKSVLNFLQYAGE